MQLNIERKAAEEMLESEQNVHHNETDDDKKSDYLASRLQGLDIDHADAQSMRPLVPEKITIPTSTSRPLTVEDEDLDLDLELDENIDTTVS